MQIVCGGKVSRLHDLLVNRECKLFAVEKFRGCMIFLLIAGKLSRLHSNSKHLIIKKKKFAGKLSRLEANPRKPQKFSTVNDLHYTVPCQNV